MSQGYRTNRTHLTSFLMAYTTHTHTDMPTYNYTNWESNFKDKRISKHLTNTQHLSGFKILQYAQYWNYHMYVQVYTLTFTLCSHTCTTHPHTSLPTHPHTHSLPSPSPPTHFSLPRTLTLTLPLQQSLASTAPQRLPSLSQLQFFHQVEKGVVQTLRDAHRQLLKKDVSKKA